MRDMFDKLKCLLGFHEWRGTETLVGDKIRQCQRCAKVQVWGGHTHFRWETVDPFIVKHSKMRDNVFYPSSLPISPHPTAPSSSIVVSDIELS